MGAIFDFFFKGSFFLKLITLLYALLFSLITNAQVDEIPNYKAADVNLHNEIVKMDSIYFTAYNTCDMKTQAKLYDENLEFFHDK